MKKLLCILFAILMCVALTTPAFAEEGSDPKSENDLPTQDVYGNDDGDDGVDNEPVQVATELYVSSEGNDETGTGTLENPYASLAKCSVVINKSAGDTKYTIKVMTDLTSTACARFYGRDVVITSVDVEGNPSEAHTVTRGDGFETISDTARSWYNPAMIEVQVTRSDNTGSLLITNLVLDDARRIMGKEYKDQYTSGDRDNLTRVQSAIIESTPDGVGTTTITLGSGAVLKNYGGMSAIRVTPGATIDMDGGSLICDNDDATKRADGSKAAIWNIGAIFNMKKGSLIENINGGSSIVYSEGVSVTTIGGAIRNCQNNQHVITTNAGSVGNAPHVIVASTGLIDHNTFSSSGAVYCNTTGDVVDIYGTISNNIAGDRGGAVAMQNGTDHIVNMYEGALLDGNETKKETAGAVLCAKGIFTMYGGAISNNKSLMEGKGYGGGVFVRDGGKFVMNGGLITDNKANYGGGIAFDADKRTKGSYALLNGGTVSGNAGVIGGNDLSVTTEKGSAGETSNISQYLVVGTAMSIDDESVYYTSKGRDFILTSPRETKQGNANSGTETKLKEVASVNSFSEPMAYLWRQSGAVDFKYEKVATKEQFDNSLPVYVIEIDTDENGDGIKNTEKFYKAVLNGEIINVSLPATDVDGRALAIVQPTKDCGTMTLTTPVSVTMGSSDVSVDVAYTAEYVPSENIQNSLKVSGGTAVFTITLDERLAAAEELTVESEMFEVVGTPSINGNKVTVNAKLKDNYESNSGDKVTITGVATLTKANFAAGKTLNSVANAKIMIDNSNFVVPSEIAKTNMLARYKVTVKYQFEDGTEAAKTFENEYAEGDEAYIVSPTVEGYEPSVAAVSVLVKEDRSEVVVYKKKSQEQKPEDKPNENHGGSSTVTPKPVVNTAVK